MYTYKEDLALNNLQWLIYYKTLNTYLIFLSVKQGGIKWY